MFLTYYYEMLNAAKCSKAQYCIPFLAVFSEQAWKSWSSLVLLVTLHSAKREYYIHEAKQNSYSVGCYVHKLFCTFKACARTTH